MTERRRETPWFWYLLAIGFLYLLASCFEPLKAINEMYPFPNTFSAHVLVGFVLIISGTVGVTLAFRKGRAIRKEIIARTGQQDSKKMVIRDRIVVYLPIAAAGAIVGISAVYTIGMIWYQKILVWILDGVILLTGFVIFQKIKELQRSRCKDIVKRSS